MSVENEMQKKTRTRLSLHQKMEIIEKSKSQTLVQLANTYHAGKTVIYDILKRKEQIKSEWLQTKDTDYKQLKKCIHENVNKAVYDWYLSACAQNLPISRVILQQKARKICTLPSINDTSFKASNGWLESFIKRHGISFGDAQNGKRPGNKYFQWTELKQQTESNASQLSINCNAHAIGESFSTELHREPSRNESVMSYREMLNFLNKVKLSAAAIGNDSLFAKIFECIEIVEKDIATEKICDHSKKLHQSGTFKLVKTIERNGSSVSAVPESWEKNNILYWPAHLNPTQQEKLRSNSGSKPDSSWTKQNCVIKIQDIDTFAEALQYEKQFAEPSSSSKMEEELKTIKYQNEFLMEKFKSFERETRQHFTSFDSKLNELVNSSDVRSAVSEDSEEPATNVDDETPINIEYVMLDPTERDKLDNCNGRMLK